MATDVAAMSGDRPDRNPRGVEVVSGGPVARKVAYRRWCRRKVSKKGNYRRYFGLGFRRWQRTSIVGLGLDQLFMMWDSFPTSQLGRSRLWSAEKRMQRDGLSSSSSSLMGLFWAVFWRRRASTGSRQGFRLNRTSKASRGWSCISLGRPELAKKLAGKYSQKTCKTEEKGLSSSSPVGLGRTLVSSGASMVIVNHRGTERGLQSSLWGLGRGCGKPSSSPVESFAPPAFSPCRLLLLAGVFSPLPRSKTFRTDAWGIYR